MSERCACEVVENPEAHYWVRDLTDQSDEAFADELDRIEAAPVLPESWETVDRVAQAIADSDDCDRASWPGMYEERAIAAIVALDDEAQSPGYAVIPTAATTGLAPFACERIASELEAIADAFRRGDVIVCFTRCEPCMFGSHCDEPTWHSWAGPEDIDHAKATGQPDPRESRCGCDCAKAER